MADHEAAYPAILQPLLDAMTAPLAAWGADGSLLACSREFARLMEMSPEDIGRRGRIGTVHPDDREDEERRVAQRRAGDLSSWRYRGRFVNGSGGVVTADCSVSPLRLDGADLADVVEFVSVQEGNAVRDALDDQAAWYTELFEHISEAIYCLDARGAIITANTAAERLFGRTLEELRHTHRSEIIARDVRRQSDDLRDQFERGERIPRRVEFQVRRPDGELRWVNGSLLMQRDDRGNLARQFVVARDVTALKEREQRLAQTAEDALREAKRDPLTGLGNRRAFDEAWQICGALAAAGQPTAIFVLDMDGLKTVNDQAGHDAGDEAIRAVGRALAQRTRGHDRIYRVGGDEFVLLISGVDPQVIAERLRQPVPFRAPAPLLRSSLGWAVLGRETDDPGEAFRLADRRMYEMKRARRAESSR